jgi:crotonobetainyl-CoA:carnitine CoA-transferase CaiB-like acyl-CoA transferase
MLGAVRVVELGTVITAPLAGMMLADFGGDVVKVERPEGDPFRRARGGAYSPNFVAFNRNKRSVVLDLATAEGRAGMMRLVARADVLLDNFRPGVLARLGLDPARLLARFPRLIQCSITGFGATGPYRDRPAFDAVAQARSGIAGMMVDPAVPEAFGPTISDNVTGMYACSAILGALFERERTGKGRRLEVNMLEASMAFIGDAFANYTQSGIAAERYSRVATSQSFALRCADATLLAIHLSTLDKFWDALLGAMEARDLAADPRFARRLDRVRNYRVLQRVLNERFLALPRAEWERRLEAADVPFAPINTIEDVLADPQVAALGTVYRTEHPTEGPLTGIQCPVLVDGARPSGRVAPAPTLGEHTAAVLAELARED